MRDVVVGLLAVLVGAVFCFRGYIAMRLVFPIWGAFVGFVTGAGLVSSFADEGFLATVGGWAIGFLLAVVFGALAYLYYAVSVVLVLAAVGYTLGATIMVAFGIDWEWLIVLVGLAVGALLAFMAVVLDLPSVLIVALTAMAGASAAVSGFMLMFGVYETDDLSEPGLTDALGDSPGWWIAWFVLAVTGAVVQLRMLSRLSMTMREAWADQGRV